MTQQNKTGRNKLYWLPALIFIIILVASVMVLTYLLEEQFHTAGFITATIMASIGFHLFSVGNTAYACAASLENEELTEYGYRANQNGIYATAGAGGVFLASVLWFLLQQIESVNEFAWYSYWAGVLEISNSVVEQLHFHSLRIMIGAGLIIFAVGFIGHSNSSKWYTVIVDEIDASPNATTRVDKAINWILSIFGYQNPEAFSEHTITIKEVDPPEFRIVEVDAPTEIEAGEEYHVRATIGNDGSQQGTCKIFCEIDRQIADSVEKTISGGEKVSVDFTDVAPMSQNRRTVGVGIEEISV